MAESDLGESIAVRVSKMNQLFVGRAGQLLEHKALVSREGLLDALLVLFEECCSDHLMKNEYITNFVKKYAKTVKELKRLRISIGDFEVKNIIGRGHFGEVQVVREKHSGDVYALKVLRKADTLAQQNVAFYEEERDIMAKSHSPWITQMQYAFQDKINLYLVMEFHPGGDLLSLLSRYDDVFEENMARFYLAEMVLATHALHTMGYVHRDVKPENILIDRTGHVKLADFGSACRLDDDNSSVSNMPVGTPDYISPEVLTKMNSNDTRGRFGPECDWWSLGICTYEMLFGKTPFTDEKGSMVTTYANIMNFKKTLKFPTTVEVGQNALDLIKRLLTESQRRMDYESICVHSFFSDINFDGIRMSSPPFIPTVTSKDDTSNFDEFEKVRPKPVVDDLGKRTVFSGRDLPFIGFTFTKSLIGMERPSLTKEVSSPACKASLERRLTMKSKELQELRDRCKNSEEREVTLKSEVDNCQRKLKDKGRLLQKVEAERDELERNMAHYITEVSSLKRICDSEKQERQSIDDKADKLLKELQEEADLAQRLRDEQYRAEVEHYEDISDKLQEDNQALLKKVEKLESELKKWKRNHEDKEDKVAQLESKVTQMRQNSQMSCQELTSDLQSKEKYYQDREEELQSQIDKGLQQNLEATKLLQQVRESKNSLEQELYHLKMKQGIDEALLTRLSDVEEKRRSLETQMHRLLIMEKREMQLKAELKEKGSHILQLAERIADLEDSLENRELEYKKCEKLYSQREEQHLLRVQDLEEQVDLLRNERHNIQEESLMVFEENEDRMRIINGQESTITLLKANVLKLEEQMLSLRNDVEARAMPTPRKKTPSKSRRSGFCQTDALLPLSAGGNRRKSGFCQTEPTRGCCGATQTDTPSPPKMLCKRSFDTQTDSGPRKQLMTTSTDCQTDDFNSSFKVKGQGRQSGATQTDRSPSPSRSTLCIQTERWSPKRKSNTESSSPRKIVSRLQTMTSEHSGTRSSSKQNESLTNISVTVKVKRRSVEDEDDTTTSTDDSSLTTITERDDDSMERCPVAAEEIWDEEEESGLSDDEEEEDETKQNKQFEAHGCQTDAELDDKEWKRKHEETLSDLTQEKKYLETKVGTLEKEIQQIRDGTHQQRVRALDLKHELREKTLQYETQIDELKAKLNKTELSLSDATETTRSLREKESMMKTKLEKVQRELDALKIESRRNISTLNEDKDELEAQVKLLKAKSSSLETSEAELRRSSDEKRIKLQRAEQQVKELLPMKQDLDERLRVALEEKGRLKVSADKTQSDLNEKRRQCEMTEQKLSQLKEVCVELEAQVRDYETLNKRYEAKEAKWTKDRNTYEKAVNERENETEQSNKQLHLEKVGRQRADEKVKELNKQLINSQESYRNEVSRLKKQLAELKMRLDSSNGQLTVKEREYTMLQVEIKTLRRKVDALEDEGIKLKEETSRLITKCTELKNSNLKLGKTLEEAMDKYELLHYKKTDLENQMETADINFNHEKYKLESTLAQQTKLIDYLQEKIENPPKKKKGLFGNKRQDQAVVSIQFRELQHHLDSARDKNSTLKLQVTKLKDELYQAKTETIRLKCRSETDIPKTFSTLSTPGPNPALSALVLSPSAQPSPGSSTNSVYSDSMSVPKCPPSSRPKKERMHHNIPHRFVTGLNSRATTCAVCLGSVHFVKQAAKCQECEVVCHPKCAPSLPATCGIPTEYVRHFTDTMTRAKAVSTSKLVSVADLRLQMRGWMKVPKLGTQVWERKYVVLENNKLNIYNNDNVHTTTTAMEEFNLCPHNGEVSIHSAVTPAELTNTASCDLPYILRLEFEPNTTCWPGRSLYLMAVSFSDKQKWAAKVEAIVNHSGKEERIRDTKLLGNTILSLAGKARIDINCTLPLRGQMVLFGADEGLFVIDISTSKAKPMMKVEGVGSVHMMSAVKGIESVAMVVGRERDLVLVDMKSLERCMCHTSQYQGDRPSILPKPVEDATAVTTFVWGCVGDAVYLCVATADKILIFKLNPGLDNFCLRKELVTHQACSCMLFARHFVLIGADKFYKIDLHSYTLSEFLDKADNSLSFAAFDAANYDSFPISVLQIGRHDQAEEFLMCFHEFGVFVDNQGRRTREKDMKWSGLPLNFAYQAPYLYIIHFNTLQVIEIMPRHYESPQGSKTFLNVPSPRYLGPALTSGAIYIGSSHENKAETICFKGNMNSQTAEDKENADLYATPNKRKTRSAKKPQPPIPTPNYSTTDTESGFVSPESTRPQIRRMSCSPRRRKPSVVSQTSTSSDCSSTDIDCNTNATSVKATIQLLEKKRRRRAAQSDLDSSY